MEADPRPSGRVLRQEVVFTRPRRGSGRLRSLLGERPIVVEAREGARLVASIESRLRKARNVSGYVRLRQTEARLPSGATWTIATEPDPASMGRRWARHRRIAARDELDRCMAIGSPAVGEERKRLSRDALGSLGDDLQSAAAAAVERIESLRGRLRSPRWRRSAAWAALGGLLVALSVGWLIAFIALVGADPGVAIGLGLAGVLAGVLGWRALRRSRASDRCRSCGLSLEGERVCGNCGTDAAEAGRTAASVVLGGAERVGRAAGRWVERAQFEPIEVSTADGSSWLLPEPGPTNRWSGAGLTATASRHGEVRIEPDGQVALEVALLVWHRVVGDTVAAEAPGGGG